MYKIRMYHLTTIAIVAALGFYSDTKSSELSQNKESGSVPIEIWESPIQLMRNAVATQSPDAVITLLKAEWGKPLLQPLYDSHFKQVSMELFAIAQQREQREKSRDAFEILCFIEYFDPHQKNQSEDAFKTYFINKWFLEKMTNANIGDVRFIFDDTNFLNNNVLPFIEIKNIAIAIKRVKHKQFLRIYMPLVGNVISLGGMIGGWTVAGICDQKNDVYCGLAAFSSALSSVGLIVFSSSLINNCGDGELNEKIEILERIKKAKQKMIDVVVKR